MQRTAKAKRTVRLIWAIVALAAAVAVGGCDQAPYGSGPNPLEPDRGATQPEGSLWERISQQRYATWKVAPGYQVPKASEGGHGERVQIFLNETAATAREQAEPRWPDGSIIVTDVHEGHEIVRVVAMEKRRGSWYFGQWTSEGTALSPDEIGSCTTCHEKGTDGTLAVRIGQ